LEFVKEVGFNSTRESLDIFVEDLEDLVYYPNRLSVIVTAQDFEPLIKASIFMENVEGRPAKILGNLNFVVVEFFIVHFYFLQQREQRLQCILSQILLKAFTTGKLFTGVILRAFRKRYHSFNFGEKILRSTGEAPALFCLNLLIYL
jgi:hypothetical protein